MSRPSKRVPDTGNSPHSVEGSRPPATVEIPAVGASAPGAMARSRNHPDPSAPPRLRTADRQQLLSALTIDDLLEDDHPARAVWGFAEGLDLTPLYDRIRARGSHPGRSAIDPRLLVALWLYATLAGVRSARALAALCVRHDAYFWLAGGIAVNAHTLADFRVQDGDFLEPLFEHSVTVLREQGLVDLRRVAQDGVRVRASAGAASFRRRQTLERLFQEAQAEVQRLQQERDALADPAATQEVATGQEPADEQPKRSEQQRAAAVRVAEDRLERVEQALERMPELEAKIKPEEKKEARVSTTDPEATVMKMADGGYRPAYNIQFGTACRGQVIVGVDVVTVGSDQGQLPPMLDQIEGRFEQRPQEALVDGGFVKFEDLKEVQGGKNGCRVYAPVPKPKKAGVDRHAPKPKDSAAVAEWRQRMDTEEAKTIYKERAATAECVNAQARNRGLVQLVVRGMEKVKAIALWFATVHNMARGFSLQPQPVGSD
jgi:transposase